jgi:hypothetical protein
LRGRIVALVGAAIVAGCGHGGESTIKESDLPNLVLAPADLPRGFTEFDSGAQRRADAHPGPREDIERFGRIEGWKARFRWIGAQRTRQPLVVESRADLFGDGGGAKQDLEAYRSELEQPPPGSGLDVAKLTAPHLGDGAVAYRAQQGPLLFVTIAWRRANVTASVMAEGRGAHTMAAAAERLARRQARRLDRAAR